MGAINTAVLILSSLTMAWAVTAAQQNKQRLLVVMLCLTLCGAAGFLVIKYFEYTHNWRNLGAGLLDQRELVRRVAVREARVSLDADEPGRTRTSDSRYS